MSMKPSLASSTLALVAHLVASSSVQAASPEEVARSELAASADAYLSAVIELAGRHRAAGRYGPARELLEAALERTGDSDRSQLWQARLLHQKGRTQVRERQFDDAKTSLEQAIHQATEIGDQLTQAAALNAFGGALLMQADFETAADQAKDIRELHLQALAISGRLLEGALSADELRRCRINVAEAHFNLGFAAEQAGALQAAEKRYLLGLEAAKLAQDRISMSFCLRHLGVIAEQSDRLDDAERFYAASLTARREAGNVAGAGFAFASLAQFLSEKKGDYTGAHSLLEESLALMEASREPVGTSVVLLQLARFHEAQEQPVEAGEYARQCIETAEEAGLTFLLQPARELLDRVTQGSR